MHNKSTSEGLFFSSNTIKSSLLKSGYKKNYSAYGGTSSRLRRALVIPLNATITTPLNAPLAATLAAPLATPLALLLLL